jgi:hypothetical protein
MSAALGTFLFHVLIYVVAAWVFYTIDRRVGQGLYRRWYNLSHEDKLPEDTIRGFICGRAGKTKCGWAVLGSLIVTIGMSALSKEGSTIAWFFTWLVGIVVTLIGFITAPLVANLWGRRQKLYLIVDQIEAGDPAEKIRRAGKKAGSWFSKIGDLWNGYWTGSVANRPAPAKDPTPAPVPPPPTAEVADDPDSVESLMTGISDGGPETPPPSPPPPAEPEMAGQDKINKFTHGGS